MKILLESEFFTFDIPAIFKGKEGATGTDGQEPTNGGKGGRAGGVAGKAGGDTKKPTKGATFDWGKELKTRLEDNRKLPAQSKKDNAVIETAFWQEFFESFCPPEIAEILNNIEQIKLDIKQLGFKAKVNPVLIFIKNKYVQTNLIGTKRINNESYKAIHNIIAKKAISYSELKSANKYNIIYCPDLYSKPAASILKYLTLQAKILDPSLSAFQDNTISLNLNTFLESGKDVRKSGAKLRKLDYIEKALGKMAGSKSSETDDLNSDDEATTASDSTSKEPDTKTDKGAVKAILASIGDEKATIVAALQFIIMYTGNIKLIRPLEAVAKKIQTKDLVSATKNVANILKEFSLSKTDAKKLIDPLKEKIGIR